MAISAPRVTLRLAQRGSRVPRWLARLVTPLLLLVVWELVVRTGLMSAVVFPPPSVLPGTFWELTSTGELPSDLGISALRALGGLAVGTVLGVAAAIVAGLWRIGEHAIDPVVQILRPLPATALTTVVVLIIGIDEPTKILLIAFGVFFPVYLNTLHGVRSVDVRFVELVAVNGFRRRDLVFQVILPAALPSFFVGFRFSVSIAWLLLVVVEQINAKSGLGYLLTEAQRYFRTDISMVVLVIYALLGLVSDALVVALSRRVLRWRREYEGA